MKLRTRLIICFFIIVLMPCALAFGMWFALGAALRQNALGIIAELDVQAQEMFVDWMISFVLILIFTAICLLWWLYTSIITPVQRLQKAARNIKEGSLSIPLQIEDQNDEISMLCRDFEDMRIQLQKVAEDNLKKEKEGKEIIRNISHDLKTPITSIKGYVEGILDGVADTPEKRERYLKIIYNKTNEMNALINELTLYSQLDTNDVPYQFAVLNVQNYFDDCAEELNIDLDEQGITFQYENFCSRETRILADPEQLRRVVSNIVGNSAKYMGDREDGHVRLTLTETQQLVQIEIADNGIGIAKGDLPYIFDRFFRSDASRNTKRGGSGIGLSIVKKIVEDHGGRIWATSEFGEGTNMFVVLKKYIPEIVQVDDPAPAKKTIFRNR